MEKEKEKKKKSTKRKKRKESREGTTEEKKEGGRKKRRVLINAVEKYKGDGDRSVIRCDSRARLDSESASPRWKTGNNEFTVSL